MSWRVVMSFLRASLAPRVLAELCDSASRVSCSHVCGQYCSFLPCYYSRSVKVCFPFRGVVSVPSCAG